MKERAEPLILHGSIALLKSTNLCHYVQVGKSGLVNNMKVDKQFH